MLPPAPVLALPKNSIGAGLNINRQGLVGSAGYLRGPWEISAIGGMSWRREWAAGVKATWKF